MIDRIRLTAAAKIQLTTLKRKTGLEHYNSICRHALCLSLANEKALPEEEYNFSGGVEIDWRTFAGGYEELYLNILTLCIQRGGGVINESSIRAACISHLHRGISYLSSRPDKDLMHL